MATYWPKEHEKSKTLPPDYHIFEIGHNIAILKRQADLTDPSVLRNLSYFKIINRKPIADDTRVVASGDLPAAAADVELSAKTYWKDWLESSDDTLYSLLVGFLSDHYCEWEVRYPSAERTGGIKSTPDNRFTQDDSPFWNPRLIVHAWEEEFPVFKLYNKSQYTLTLAMIRAIGYKYSLAKLAEGKMAGQWPPSPVSYIVLEDVPTT
jgi:hypothetical protein